MLFSLEALQAKRGDSLLLHYGPSQAGARLIVIDGGPPGVYKASLAPRLAQLKKSRTPNGSLPIRLLMVSHIDEDHIAGVLDLGREIVKATDDQTTPRWDVLSLWHNSFSDLVKPVKPSDLGADAAEVNAAAVLEMHLPPKKKLSPETVAVISSVSQGRELRKIAEQLSWNVNHGFCDLVTAGAASATVKKMDVGLEFVLLGPLQAQLDLLQTEWSKEITRLKKKGPLSPAEADVTLADYVEKTASNLSSIAVLARFGGKKMLLTGDARGDTVIDAAKAAKLLKNGKLHVDLHKVPHHGSIRNVKADYFETFPADTYVFSADGTDDNPDKKTLELLVDVRGQAQYTIVLTNPVPHAVKFLETAKKTRKFKLVVRKPADLSVRVDLGTPLKD
jgi:hypothetical protein